MRLKRVHRVRLESNRHKPNLFIPGAAKAGTTSIYKYLNGHPDVFMSPIKEPHFFSRDITIHRSIRTEHEYLDLFRNVGNRRCFGEASTSYLPSKVAARLIYEFNPDAKIIISLRNPVDMMYSTHFFLVYVNLQKTISFREALENSKSISDHRFSEGAFDYRSGATLSPQVKRFLSVFPRNQVLIVLFDDLKSHPEPTYRQILEFIGVDPSFVPDFGRANVSRQAKWSLLHDLIVDPPPWLLTICRPLLKSRLFHQFVERVDTLNSQPVNYPTMDRELRRQLIDEFSQEIEDLARITGKNLSHWFID